MIKISAEKIHHTILLYATIALLIITTVIAAISVIPLYSQLKQLEYTHLGLMRDSSVNIVDEAILSLEHSAGQIANLPKGQQLMSQYQRGEISKSMLTRNLKTILAIAINHNPKIIGITRLDPNGNVLLSLGDAISNNILPKYPISTKIKMLGPYKQDNRQIIIIVTPIHYGNIVFMGTDITYYDVSDLRNDIQKKLKRRTGEIIIAHKVNSKIRIISATDLSSLDKHMENNSTLIHSLAKAINQRISGITTTHSNDNNIVIAYAPIKRADWGLAVITNETKLFAPYKHLTYLIIGIIILVAVIFTMALIMILRPLSGKLIMHEKELEQRIDSSQAALRMANIKLKYLSEHDSLTNLGNRRGFTRKIAEELSRAKRHNEKFALFFIDINKFKQLNDKYGHHVGDSALIEIGKRLQKILRKEDYIARLGGDELAIIIPDFNHDEDLNAIVHKIKSTMKNPIIVQNHQFKLSISVGMAVFPDDGFTMRQLLTHADTEMYKQKPADS